MSSLPYSHNKFSLFLHNLAQTCCVLFMLSGFLFDSSILTWQRWQADQLTPESQPPPSCLLCLIVAAMRLPLALCPLHIFEIILSINNLNSYSIFKKCFIPCWPLLSCLFHDSYFTFFLYSFFSKRAILHSHLLLCTKSENLQTHLFFFPSSTQVTAWLEYWWAPHWVSIKHLSLSLSLSQISQHDCCIPPSASLSPALCLGPTHTVEIQRGKDGGRIRSHAVQN